MNVDELITQTGLSLDSIVPSADSQRASAIFEKSLLAPIPKAPRRISRRLLMAAAAILLIAGVSTVVSVRGPNDSAAITRAFGVVNAGASTGGFSSMLTSPPGFNLLTCPTGQVCYVALPEGVDKAGNPLPTTAYKTVDGGASWTAMLMPAAGIPDTPFSCPSVSVCSLGVATPPSGSSGPFSTGTIQSILSTTDGGATWTRHVVSIKPVTGIDPSLDGTLANVEGRWTHLQCFSSASCIATASVPSDQPQAPANGVGDVGVYRAVIMRTLDGGATWTSELLPWLKNLDGSSGWSNSEDIALSCSTANDCVGLSVVNKGLANRVLVWRTKDGGVRWVSSLAPEQAIGKSTLTCPTTQQCYAVVFTGVHTEQIMVTKDGGVSWTFENPTTSARPSAINMYHSISCTSSSTCWLAGELLNGHNGEDLMTYTKASIWSTNDSGRTWTSVPLPPHLGFALEVACNLVASCLAVAWPPTVVGRNSVARTIGTGKILSNQRN